MIRPAVAVAAAAAVGVVVFPDLLFGLDRLGPFARLVALRPHIVVTTFAAAGIMMLSTGSRSGSARAGSTGSRSGSARAGSTGSRSGSARAGFPRLRFWWSRYRRSAAVGLLTVSVLGAAVVAPRAIPGDATVTTVAAGRTLTVLSFNTFEGTADQAALTEVIRRERPDLVSLPESGDEFRARLAPLVEPLGYRLWSSTAPGRRNVLGVTALARVELGEVTVRVEPATRFPALELSGAGLGPMRFVAFHSVAPVSGGARRWRADLDRLPYWCAGGSPAIVAGDFNATLDHSVFRAALRGCTDAASQRGAGLIPTWAPTRSLRPIGIQLDHVLTTAGIRAESFEVLDLPGSDHRAILTRLRLPS